MLSAMGVARMMTLEVLLLPYAALGLALLILFLFFLVKGKDSDDKVEKMTRGFGAGLREILKQGNKIRHWICDKMKKPSCYLICAGLVRLLIDIVLGFGNGA